MNTQKDGWLTPRIKSTLSQGDVLDLLPFPSLSPPLKRLIKNNTGKKGLTSWVETDLKVTSKADYADHLIPIRNFAAIVLSHDCDLDKHKKRVIVAPIAALDSLDTETREIVLQQRHFAMMPLPEIPGIGTGYVDLRCITSVDRNIVDSASRIASMTDTGKARLEAQITTFFLRKTP